jgi:hypothetical protein
MLHSRLNLALPLILSLLAAQIAVADETEIEADIAGWEVFIDVISKKCPDFSTGR